MKLRKSAALRLSALFVLSATASARPRSGRFRVAFVGPEDRVREVHAAERAPGHPARRSQAADRAREPVVPRGLQERAAGPHGLRAPLRAHDVPGLGQREGGLLHLRRDARRQPPGGRRQRHDEPGPHELLRDRALREPRDAPVARVGPPRHAARRDDEGEARQPARRRQERAAPGPREHALRPLVQARPGEPLPGRPSLLVAHDRKPRGPHGRVARGRHRLLQDVLHARTTSRSSSPATSTRRRRSGSSRSTSAPIPPGRRSTARRSTIPTLTGEKIVEASDRVSQDRVYMVWPTPPGFRPATRISTSPP